MKTRKTYTDHVDRGFDLFTDALIAVVSVPMACVGWLATWIEDTYGEK